MRAIQELEKTGYIFWLEGEKIQFKYQGEDKPVPDQVRPLLEELKARKPEALAYLQARAVEEDNQGKEPQQTDFQAEFEKITVALRKHGLAKIYSETLGEEVWWAREEGENPKAPAGAVVYTLDELKELARDGNMTREGLMQLHLGKSIFNGKLVYPGNL